MKNSEVIVPFTKLAKSDIDGLSYNLSLEVKREDILRFVLGKCDSENNASVHYEKNANIIGWNSIIEYPVEKSERQDFVYRINCGGNEFTDDMGAVWSADTHFTAGETLGNATKLFLSARSADAFSYKIPVPTGIYAVRLLFSENEYEGVNERFTEIRINGSLREAELDIAQCARGVRKAYSKVYHYVIPNENGEIDISLKSIKGGAVLCGIEIMNENDDVYHINCGGEDFVDWAGYVWQKDKFFEGGEGISESPVPLKQASPTLYDKALYFTGRIGTEFSYEIPVRDGIYSVQLKFAEFILTSPDTRPIDIYINGAVMKENYDSVRSPENAPMSADVRFDDISSQNGVIKIRIISRSDKPAILRAIEID